MFQKGQCGSSSFLHSLSLISNTGISLAAQKGSYGYHDVCLPAFLGSKKVAEFRNHQLYSLRISKLAESWCVKYGSATTLYNSNAEWRWLF
jgi:hypothetical protein